MDASGPQVPEGAGAVVTIPYGPVAGWLADAGHRWLVIDAEHAPMGPDHQLALITAAHASDVSVYVRVAANDERLIGFALDAGADGVIVPGVDTAQEAWRAAAGCRYPPDGVRSIGPIRRQAPIPCCIVQLETREAASSALDITAVPGVHAVMMGPGDLALDLGLRPGLDSHHPQMLALYEQVRRAAKASGKASGTFALLGTDDVNDAVAQQWDFIVTCLDRTALVAAAADLRVAHGGR